MLYSEFLEGCGVTESEHNYKVYRNLEAMYMNTDMSKAEVYEYGKKLVKKPEPVKLIKVMSVPDNSGYYTTPNGCYCHLVDVEVVNVSIKTGKITVKVIPDSYRLGYAYDFRDCDHNIIVK